ncbi:SphA family protein [Burkholderia glumae]|uniref:Transporter n=1 Tax=Burkholderia glumae TaxID=337 RepID=A0ABY5BBD3_BURGL|nr:transporter [Burkholderia glumae]MCM2546259.1 transporter [Burkholderia glumae]MCQ0034256.1 transporter [Burkholderia glumae]MCQ0038543.1 transporter [Burkholderia glumae]MCR1770828.1 transporter [Burkholderia glumae]USS44242.1 transporter [Burkholderia glumae]
MKTRFGSVVLAAATGVAVLAAMPAVATENGIDTYPVGVNTVLDGILPPPGDTRFYNYTQYYVANKFAGANGESSVPGFRSSVLVDAPRVVHTWGPTLGPFTISTGLIVPLFHTNVRVPVGSGIRTGFGDIILHPLMLGYVNPSHSLFVMASTDIGFPTGSYNVNRIANTGTNTYAFMPNVSATWFPTPDWELSGTAQVEFNSPNHATNYHNGAVATFDWVVGYSVTKAVQLGIQGFYLKQISDDKQNGVPAAGNGFRGQAVGIGPQIRWDWVPGSSVVFKYQHEFAVRNRPQGERLWLEVSVPFK